MFKNFFLLFYSTQILGFTIESKLLNQNKKVFNFFFFLKDDNRIIGGNPSSFGQFPFAVALLRIGEQKPYGGSILNKEWILTSAECVATYVDFLLIENITFYL